MLRPILIAAGLYVALPLQLQATDALPNAVREAVTARRLQDSELKGFGSSLAPYRDLATDGGLLVGLDVAVGGCPPVEHVLAVRPIYRSADRVRTGPPAGRFLSDDVVRTVRLVAPDDSAVAGITFSGDRSVEGISLRYARVGDDGLHTAEMTESEWIGSKKSTRRISIDGCGRPIVGLFGCLDDATVSALGATVVDLPWASMPTPAVTPPVIASQPQEQPETPAAVTAETPAGASFLPFIVFGAVTVPIGIVSMMALRRNSSGIRRLPRAAPASIAQLAVAPPRPPSIPCDVFDLDELVHTRFPTITPQLHSETECVR
ncbi:MAG TPA: hypothetical protein VHR66_10720 [Gemmataceae bacterium]|jgi:hypothetical protein|nr:hypothetical protein [Gemmataceae bacterium]